MPTEELSHADPDTKPCSLSMGHLGCWCPRLTAPLSHILPTVGDDHLLLGLPVLAALGLCGLNRRGGIGREAGE